MWIAIRYSHGPSRHMHNLKGANGCRGFLIFVSVYILRFVCEMIFCFYFLEFIFV